MPFDQVLHMLALFGPVAGMLGVPCRVRAPDRIDRKLRDVCATRDGPARLGLPPKIICLIRPIRLTCLVPM